MIYVSLPVHEKFDVVASQLQNFKKYLPAAVVVIHLSADALFSIKELDGFLKLNNLDNYLINPVQVKTGWGKIIFAHLENIGYIIGLGDASKIIFHSSNDMLVRDGLSQYLQDKNFLFHRREIIQNSFWWPANAALNDLPFNDWLSVCGGGAVVASQIEGSMYSIDFLRECYGMLMGRYQYALQSDNKYPREEFYFSSLAKALNVRADGLPYVFSEIHRFDKKLWSYHATYPFLFDDEHYLTKRLKKRLNDVLFDANFYKISIKDIEAIRCQDINYLKSSQYMSDGANLWQVHTIDNLFAVKRVPRLATNKIRQYINNLSSNHA